MEEYTARKTGGSVWVTYVACVGEDSGYDEGRTGPVFSNEEAARKYCRAMNLENGSDLVWKYRNEDVYDDISFSADDHLYTFMAHLTAAGTLALRGMDFLPRENLPPRGDELVVERGFNGGLDLYISLKPYPVETMREQLMERAVERFTYILKTYEVSDARARLRNWFGTFIYTIPRAGDDKPAASGKKSLVRMVRSADRPESETAKRGYIRRRRNGQPVWEGRVVNETGYTGRILAELFDLMPEDVNLPGKRKARTRKKSGRKPEATEERKMAAAMENEFDTAGSGVMKGEREKVTVRPTTAQLKKEADSRDEEEK